MSFDPALSLPLAWFLAGILGIAAAHKLLHREEFMTALEGYALAPRWSLPGLTLILAALEGMTGLGLIFPAAMSVAAMLAATLFAGYALAMAAAIMRGRAGIDCGCHFGAEADPLSWWTIIRNFALVCAGLLVALPAGRPITTPDVVSGALAGTALLLILHSARILKANRAWIRTLKGAS